jgi:raffinose/stachyose/melibiose transport system permease protein
MSVGSAPEPDHRIHPDARAERPQAAFADPSGAVKPARTAQRRRVRSVGASLWWFALPALVVYAYVVLIPAARGVWSAFTNWSFAHPEAAFIGLDNFTRALQSDAGLAARNTLFIAIVVVIVENVLGFGLALLLHGRIAGKHVLRTVIFAPLVVSSLVVGYLFKYIFGPAGSGGINGILAALGQHQVDFLGNPSTALWIIMLAVIWQFTGATMVIYLAGLQSVPPELEEAAALDGASYWQRVWHVIRPLIAPAITINLMIGLIGGLKIFDQIFAITNGGPGNQTQTISTLQYLVFSSFAEYGRAAAIAVILTIGVGVLAFIQFSVLRRQEEGVR